MQHVTITAFEFTRFEVQTHLFPVVNIFDSLDSQALGHQWILSFNGSSFLEPVLSQNDPFAQNMIFMTKTTAWFSCTALFSICKIYIIFLIPFPFVVQNFEKKIIRSNLVLQRSVNFAAKLGTKWPIFLELEFSGKINITYLFYLEYSDYLIFINLLHLDKFKFLFYFKWKTKM